MELKDKVVISNEDIDMVEDFFHHYNDSAVNNLLITPNLANEISKFKDKAKTGSYSIEDQRQFTIALCDALRKTTHPLLRDVAIEAVLKACDNVASDAQFYEEFEKAIQVSE